VFLRLASVARRLLRDQPSLQTLRPRHVGRPDVTAAAPPKGDGTVSGGAVDALVGFGVGFCVAAVLLLCSRILERFER
jgi:hypothetical protein